MPTTGTFARSLAISALVCLPLLGCDSDKEKRCDSDKEEKDEPTGACVLEEIELPRPSHYEAFSCIDDMTQSDCEDAEGIDGSFEVSTFFHEDESCSELGYDEEG